MLQPVDVIVEKLRQFKSAASKILKGISDKEVEFAAIKEEQATRSNELDDRETEIKKIEDVVELKESTQALLNQSAEASKTLLKAQQDFRDNVAKERADIAKKVTDNKATAEKLERDSAAIIETMEKLGVEKKKMKEKILKELLS